MRIRCSLAAAAVVAVLLAATACGGSRPTGAAPAGPVCTVTPSPTWTDAGQSPAPASAASCTPPASDPQVDQVDTHDCDADDMLEGDTDCGFSRPKKATTKPRTTTKAKTTTGTKPKTGKK